MQERRAARRTTETMRDVGENAREVAGRAQESSSSAVEGFREYQLRLVSAAQANANALFEYVQDVIQAQSISELVELSTSHSRRQFEMMAEQTRELANSAQKIASDTTRPLAGVFGNQGAR